MSNKQEDVNIILRLYELRREETMRKARDWFLTDFNPESTQDLLAVMVGKDNSAYRMVSSYWDMAATFVNHGTIDEQLFNDIHFEHIAVYAKLQPFLAEFRAHSRALLPDAPRTTRPAHARRGGATHHHATLYETPPRSEK
ncbi:MAG TPA: hypothetical protein VK363_13565 [Pyrinomonadaceae bacterium]|nr:hypothetical protein [Pyrinomonadaceae bacterium]